MDQNGGQMEAIITWFTANKEWFFSGIGVVLISGIIALFLKKKKDHSQNQEVSDNSIGIQAGGDINIPSSIVRRQKDGNTKSKNRRK